MVSANFVSGTVVYEKDKRSFSRRKITSKFRKSNTFMFYLNISVIAKKFKTIIGSIKLHEKPV